MPSVPMSAIMNVAGSGMGSEYNTAAPLAEPVSMVRVSTPNVNGLAAFMVANTHSNLM